MASEEESEQAGNVACGYIAPVQQGAALVPTQRAKAKTQDDSDNDNDNDTLREVPHPSNEGLALQARVSGP